MDRLLELELEERKKKYIEYITVFSKILGGLIIVTAIILLIIYTRKKNE